MAPLKLPISPFRDFDDESRQSFLRILLRKSEKTDPTGVDLKDGSYQLLVPLTGRLLRFEPLH